MRMLFVDYNSAFNTIVPSKLATHEVAPYSLYVALFTRALRHCAIGSRVPISLTDLVYLAYSWFTE